MSSLFVDTHNVVAIFKKSNAAEGFEQIIDFLSGSYIHYALTVNPHICISCIKQFWNTASVKHSDDVTRLQALVDRKKIMISEDIIREILQLDDAEGVVCLPNEEIFAGLAQMGYEKPSTKLTFYKAFFVSQWKFFIHTLLQSLSAKRTSWNKFSTAMASAVICLSKGQKFNFSKYIFDSLVRNVDSSSKFYMYPRFIQLIIQNHVGDLSTHTIRFISPALTQKVFANMRQVGKGFSAVETPLFEGMLAARQLAEEGIAEEQCQADDAVAVVQENVAEDIANDAIPSPSSHAIPSHSQEQSSPPQQPQTAQKLEIIKLKAMVKRLEKANKVKSSKLRRLRKVGASKRIESSNDIEDVFNQGRMIDDSDTDEGIERKGVIIRDPEEELSLKTLVETLILKDKGKGILIETLKPIKKKDQIELEAEYARKLHEEINKDHEEINKDIDWDAAIDHVNQKSKNPQYIKRYQGMKKRPQTEINRGNGGRRLGVIKSINETPVQNVAKRRKLNEEAQEAEDLKKRLEVVDDEDDYVFTEATPLARKLILLVERRYPLSKFTQEQLVNVTRLQVKEESETLLELLRFTRQQLQEYLQG
nr:hypothetical protein [Tanacetum cinerariifolium]